MASTSSSSASYYKLLPSRPMASSTRRLSSELNKDDLEREEELSGEVSETGEFKPLERRLASRHLIMIAIGGIIGPGLLVGSGNALATAGPGGALIAFIVVAFIVFFTMQSLGELTTYAPVSGSFTTYAGRYIDPAVSFALGWNYWWLWITVLANEYNNVSLLIWYWPQAQALPEGGYIAIFFFVVLGFSFLGVRAYGEAEFWLTLIKVIAIFIFFIVAIIIDTGGIGSQGYIGARYWSEPGAFTDGLKGVASVFVVAATLYAGCESVGVVAGESRTPAKDVPRAIRSIFARVVFFYWGSVFFIGLLIPYNNDQLLNAANKASLSPFTIALQAAGIKVGADVMNAVIIVTVLSAGNSSLYLTSRILVGLAREGRAPRWMGHTNKRGVPWPALIFSNIFGLLALLKYAKGSGSGKVFGYLMNLSGVSTFIVWGSICISHIRFRRAFKKQGRSLDELDFKAFLYPYGAYFALGANIFLIFFQGFTTLAPFSAVDFVVAYIIIPVFLILFVGWKFYHKTRFVRLEEMDLDSDRRQVERERDEQGIIDQEVEEEEYGKKTAWGKTKAWASAVVA
ncbi:amino acid permease [Leucosporidium creatinivorum]|uniref:Amino acid permease n=1 Tax=Leucosporidium creatinivorum TaxID=106004 RepID=A0A1Y2FU24_9BASI|nr:amino acid permease [Leucosporidium creatinivorum]